MLVRKLKTTNAIMAKFTANILLTIEVYPNYEGTN